MVGVVDCIAWVYVAHNNNIIIIIFRIVGVRSSYLFSTLDLMNISCELLKYDEGRLVLFCSVFSDEAVAIANSANTEKENDRTNMKLI